MGCDLSGFVQVGGEESEMGVVGEQNIFFPCLCMCPGRRRTVSFKTTLLQFFFFMRSEKKLILKNNSKIKHNNIFLNKNNLKNNLCHNIKHSSSGVDGGITQMKLDLQKRIPHRLIYSSYQLVLFIR
jgi:hypothetical protein